MLVHELITLLRQQPPSATVIVADTLDKYWLVLRVESDEVFKSLDQQAVAIWLGPGGVRPGVRPSQDTGAES